MTSAAEYQRTTDNQLKYQEQLLALARNQLGVLQSPGRFSDNQDGEVHNRTGNWATWFQTGVTVHFSVSTGRVLVTVSAATFCANTRVVVGYRITDERGNIALAESTSIGYGSDKRSPLSELDRPNNGMFCMTHQLPVGRYVARVLIYADTAGPLFGLEEVTVGDVGLTVEDL